MRCSIQDGPYSPIRRGSGNNIYVIPAPDNFSFGTATLIAAACCIPTILLLVSMWLKILKINYEKAFGDEKANDASADGEKTVSTTVAQTGDDSNAIAPASSIQDTADTTFAADQPKDKGPESALQAELSSPRRQHQEHSMDIPAEGASAAVWPVSKAKLKALINTFGEYYQVPVFGAAAFAVLVLGERNMFSRQVRYQTEPVANIGMSLFSHILLVTAESNQLIRPLGQWAPIVATVLGLMYSLYFLFATAMDEEAKRIDSVERNNAPTHDDAGREESAADVTPGSTAVQDSKHDSKYPVWVLQVARVLLRLSNWISIPQQGRFDETIHTRGRSTGYPTIPGEPERNRSLSRIETQWTLDSDHSEVPRIRSPRSRACSHTGSSKSKEEVEHVEGSVTLPEATYHARRQTLDLPSPVRRNSPTTTSSGPLYGSPSGTAAAEGPSTPAIVVSSPTERPSNAET